MALPASPPPSASSPAPVSDQARGVFVWPRAVQLALFVLFGLFFLGLLYRGLCTTGPRLAPLDDELAPIRVELNHASKDEFLLLPGIGPKLAQRLVDHRGQHGLFKTVNELRSVPGIGPITLERLRPLVYVEGVAPTEPARVSRIIRARAKTTATSSPSTSKKTAALGDRRIDVNQAGADEMQKLPGIGPKLAERIISYRSNKGPFASVQDLRKVSGIGAKTLEKLKPHIVLSTNVEAIARQ